MAFRRSILALLVLAPVLVGGVPAAAGTQAYGFTNASNSSGILVNIQGLEREDWGFGCAFVDYDGDGDVDLYAATATAEPNHLYRQNADGSFSDVAVEAGVADMRDGRAVKFADYDNDGDQDFFLGNYRARNCLYRNNGDGTFTDVADDVMGAANTLTFGGSWGDYDNDGWLDLYVVNRRSGRDAGINQLFHNNGDGTFTEVGHEKGVDDPNASLEAVWVDYDNDNDVDLYLSQDKYNGNRLWRNEGDGAFTEVSFESGSDVQLNSMGVAVGDFDNNGYSDIYLANTPDGWNANNKLLRNNGDGTFTEYASQAGCFGGRYSWGVAFFDYDNDGDLDLYVVNWDVTPGSYAAGNQLFKNQGDGSFVDVAPSTGVADTGPGYALSIGDFDGNGYQDMFVSNNMSPSVLYRNNGGGNHWLRVCPIGTESNRDGIGARVSVKDGSFSCYRDIDGGTSYLAHNQKDAFIGVGGIDVVDEVSVRWPSGWTDNFTNVPSNRVLVVREGETAPVAVSVMNTSDTEAGLHLEWAVNRDVIVTGYRVYRTGPNNPQAVNLVPDALIEKSVHEFTDASKLPPETEYEYQVAAVLEDNTEVFSDGVSYTTPRRVQPLLALAQNYPNPFNPGTTISFELPAAGPVKLSVYNSAGRRVGTVVDAELGAGPHAYAWRGIGEDGLPLVSGVYFYRLQTPSGVLTRKMVHVK